MEEREEGQAPEALEADSTQEPAAQPDPYRNLKTEVTRKLENQSAMLAEQNKRLEAILATVQERMAPKAPEAPSKPLKDLVFEDADQFASVIERRAGEIASRVVEQKVQLSQATQSAVSEVLNVYPEFGQPGSEAASLALQKSAQLPKHLQGTPEGIKMVMFETASELGLVPAKARKAAAPAADDFALGGSTQPRQPKKSPTDGVAPETIEFAKLMGIDVSDPKRLEGLKAASQRKTWNQYR